MTEQSSILYVQTETSRYVIDMVAMTATRLPGYAGRDSVPSGDLSFVTAELRREGEPLHLYEMPDIKVGQGMDLLIQVREDGGRTTRMTTAVREVRPLL